MKTLFCVLGRTGTGKDSIVDQVCKLTGMSKVKSFTTRPQRGANDITHVFIKPNEVEKYKKDIAAYTKSEMSNISLRFSKSSMPISISSIPRVFMIF